MIRVGAIVKVINWGAMYTTPKDWFEEHEDISRNLLMRFAWEDGRPDNVNCQYYSRNKEFRIEYLDLDSFEPRALISGVSESDYRPVYCIGIDGLEEAVLEVTMDEIEAKFGRKVKIVERKKGDDIPF